MELHLNGGRSLEKLQRKGVTVNEELGVREDFRVVPFSVLHECEKVILTKYQDLIFKKWEEYMWDKLMSISDDDSEKREGELVLTIVTPTKLPPPRSEGAYAVQDIPVEVKLRAPLTTSGEEMVINEIARFLGASKMKLRMMVSHNMYGTYSGNPITSSEVVCSWNEGEQQWEGSVARTLTTDRVPADGKSPEISSRVEALYLVLMDGALSVLMRGKEKFEGQIAGMRSLLEEETFSDMVITGSNGVPVKCHRAHVVPASPVFARMFSPTSTLEESKTCSLEIAEMTEAGVRALLKFIYFWDTEAIWNNVEVALELLEAAHKYLMPHLIEVTTTAIMIQPREEFTVDTAVKLYCFVCNVGGGTSSGDGIFDLKHKSIGVFNWFRARHMDKVRASRNFNELYDKRNEVDSGVTPEMIRFLEGKLQPVELPTRAPKSLFIIFNRNPMGGNCSIV